LKRVLPAAALALAMGCGSNSSPLLSNTYPSRETLANAVVAAVGRRDAATLRELALSEEEFREQVWPELPAARPERNLPFSYVWGDLRQKSDESLARTLARHGGRSYALVAVRSAGETTRYPSYNVFRETVLQVRDETGTLVDLRLFGSTIEKDGAWKVFSYVIDE
jgi:hypothetical protein